MKYRLFFLMLLNAFVVNGCKRKKPEWNVIVQQPEEYIAQCIAHADQAELELLHAIFDADLEKVKQAVAKGKCDVNSLAGGRTTFLHAVADSGTFEGNDKKTMANIVDVLIKIGADVNRVDQDGQTPLIFAARIRNTPFGKLMIEKGAMVNTVDHRGKTVLIHLAASVCPWRLEFVEKLFSEAPEGFNPDTMVAVDSIDNDGKKALDYALENVEGPDRDKVIAILRRNGAKRGRSF